MTPDQTTPEPTRLDAEIKILLPSALKLAFRIRALENHEDMSEVVRRAIEQYVNAK